MNDNKGLDFLDNYSCLQEVISFLSFCTAATDIKPGRGKADFISDRLANASCESTLFKCLAQFRKSLNVGPGKEEAIFRVAGSKFADSVLRLIREYPVEVTGILFTKKEGKPDSIYNLFKLTDFEPVTPSPVPKRVIEVPLEITLIEPLIHGDENKQGNAVLFRRRKTSLGDALPFYSANALRHKLRVLLAEDYLRRINLHPSTTDRRYRVWFNEFMHNGGKLGSAPKEFCKRVGGSASGSIKADGMIEMRNMIPFISLLGGNAKGSFEGRLMVKDLRPVCKEWGTGEHHYNDLLAWEFGTTPDPLAESAVSKAEAKADNDARANTSMIYKFQAMIAGAKMEGGFNISSHATDIERSCLGHGINLLTQHAHLGAKTNRGYGACAIDAKNAPDAKAYLEYIEERKEEMEKYINDIGAF